MKYIFCILLGLVAFFATVRAMDGVGMFRVEDIVQDIYEQLTETNETDFTELQEELFDLAEHPVNINRATVGDLEKLRFLSPEQIDNILLYVYKHPLENLYELQLIDGLHDYDIRNLCAFVVVGPTADSRQQPSAKEVFHYGKHEILARTDVRNLETYIGDPVYVQCKYKFNYDNRVRFGAVLRREPGTQASALEYGGYVQLNDFGPFRTIVAGNFQAQFGQGLVLSNPYHRGKSNYVTNVGMAPQGLKKYTSADGDGLHGVGATLSWDLPEERIRNAAIDFTAFYSLTRTNDSIRRHVVGSNLSFRYAKLQVGVTFAENIWSDSLGYYHSPRYTEHYFHGRNQAIVGVNFRYNYGWFDVFGEVATAQNTCWGVGVQVGSRFTPVSDVGLVVLYRYYSPTFGNTLGYGFSESSRINDENGLYISLDVSRLKHWRFSAYGDVFRFDGVKYGIPFAPSYGYDALLQIQWLYSEWWDMAVKLRARDKAKKGTYSLRWQFNRTDGNWKLRTQADANLVKDSVNSLTWGIGIFQDVQYCFSTVPLTLQLRLQAFHACPWDNRIYVYENDVLYAFSMPAIYGQGGRAYLNLRWRILPQLSLYFRVSETIYARRWAEEQKRASMFDTDVHLLLRAYL